jgi:ribonuclease HI
MQMPYTRWWWTSNKRNRRLYIRVYTHGACSGNGQDGALAAGSVYVGHKSYLNVFGVTVPGRQTSNRAALVAVTTALRSVVENRKPEDKRTRYVEIHTNSSYPAQCWRRGQVFDREGYLVPNHDLVVGLLQYKCHFKHVSSVARSPVYRTKIR